MKCLLPALAVLLLFVTPAAGQDLSKGDEAYERGDYATAMREWRPLAEQGEAEAQLNIGVMYSLGDGVPQDYTEAERWYRLAAEQGNAEGQRLLGITYARGEGVLQDYVEAHMWFNLAAAQGDTHAINNLNIVGMFMTTADISKAQRMAREWLEAHPQ